MKTAHAIIIAGAIIAGAILIKDDFPTKPAFAQAGTKGYAVTTGQTVFVTDLNTGKTRYCFGTTHNGENATTCANYMNDANGR